MNCLIFFINGEIDEGFSQQLIEFEKELYGNNSMNINDFIFSEED